MAGFDALTATVGRESIEGDPVFLFLGFFAIPRHGLVSRSRNSPFLTARNIIERRNSSKAAFGRAGLVSCSPRRTTRPPHRLRDYCTNCLRRLYEMGIGKVGVARRGPVPPVPERPADQRKILAGHHGLAGGGMAKVMQA